MFKRLLILFGLTILVFSAGCVTKEEKAVRQTVTKYNENLALALKRPQPELMLSLTTPKEYERILTYILYWQQQKKILSSRLNNLNIEQVEIEGEKATVKTREQWSYEHLDRENRKVVKPTADINYQATYRLEKIKGKWVVASLEVKDDRKKQKK